MKALTLWQPWASLIADGRKTIETRPRAWAYRGIIAIHAGNHVDREACKRFGYDPDTIPRGCVVCLVFKDGCVQFPNPATPPDEYGNFAPGRYGYILHNPRKFNPPVPIRGWQGVWDWPDVIGIQPQGELNCVLYATTPQLPFKEQPKCSG